MAVGLVQEGGHRRPARRCIVNAVYGDPTHYSGLQLVARDRASSRSRSTATSPATRTSPSASARVMGFELMENFDRPYCSRVDRRVLAALAHLALDLVPGLRLHPARRQPRVACRGGTCNSDRDVPRQRPLARRELDVRRSGAPCTACYLVVGLSPRTRAVASGRRSGSSRSGPHGHRRRHHASR